MEEIHQLVANSDSNKRMNIYNSQMQRQVDSYLPSGSFKDPYPLETSYIIRGVV